MRNNLDQISYVLVCRYFDSMLVNMDGKAVVKIKKESKKIDITF